MGGDTIAVINKQIGRNMAVMLGVDTGGTYTDAVLIRDETDIIATAKSLTTRHDLAEGIKNAVVAVLHDAGVSPGEIAMASLSTTLATNALVEGQGGRVALVYIGFGESDLTKHGIQEALNGDPVLALGGGHDHAGNEASPLDFDDLLAWLDTVSDISGFAVASQFATRNPAHENAVAEIIRQKTGQPVSCSHHLSARLNGPKRALTAVLNARLIGMIDRLIGRAQQQLIDLGITAPMMVVRGDGALISAEIARERPIETILSGPAASIVGAQWMTGVKRALISDIGGTTTDIAVLRDGRPMIDPAGARVGPFRTMVEAVAMRTTGLGGDSEVRMVADGLRGGIILGPRRVLPISLVAMDAPDVVLRALESQLSAPVPGEYDGQFVRIIPGIDTGGISTRDANVLARMGGEVRPVGDVLQTRVEGQSLRRLVARGIVQIAGVTPSDASHVLGTLQSWNVDAAKLSLQLLARRKVGSGNVLADGAQTLAQIIIDQVTEQTSLALLETAFSEDGHQFGVSEDVLARHILTQMGLSKHRGLVALDTALNLPVVGLGASAASYYPAVRDRLRCEMILPRYAGVANAVGAVVGQVSMRQSGTVTSPAEGKFRVHGEHGPMDFSNPEDAMAALEAELRKRVEGDAQKSGAVDISTTATRDIRRSQVESRDVFIEAMITVEASGRPRIADG